jgi:hypothetical protein
LRAEGVGGEHGVTGYLQMLLGTESDHGRGTAVMGGVDARRLIERLVALAPSSRPGAETELAARGRDRRGDDIVLGVRMVQVFGLAAEFIEMDPSEVEKLLESPIHEVRVGALSIMDKQGRRRWPSCYSTTHMTRFRRPPAGCYARPARRTAASSWPSWTSTPR